MATQIVEPSGEQREWVVETLQMLAGSMRPRIVWALLLLEHLVKGLAVLRPFGEAETS